MFRFGKLKEKPTAATKENHSTYLVDHCIEKGFMPLKEVNNDLPVLLKFPLLGVTLAPVFANYQRTKKEPSL